MTTKNSTKHASKKNASTKNVSEEVETTPDSGESTKASAPTTTSQNDVGVELNSAFGNMSIEEMQQQLEARKSNEIRNLESREAELKTELATTQQRINFLKGAPKSQRGPRRGGPRGPRAKNDHTLVEVVHNIVRESGRAMSAREVEEALKKTDYKSTSQNLYTQIFTVFSKNPKMFGKEARGMYAAKDIDPTADDAPEGDETKS